MLPDPKHTLVCLRRISRQGGAHGAARRLVLMAACTALLAACTTIKPKPSREEQIAQVTSTEMAFAKSMADRDFTAFMQLIADDAVFLNGGKPLRGKAEIGAYWRRFYSGTAAPFSWRPDLVEVLGSGSLAQSAGPVSDADGKLIARFYSTWRLEPDGNWRIVLDDGYDVCQCPAK